MSKLAAGFLYKVSLPQVLSDYTEITTSCEPPSQACFGRLFIILANLANFRAALAADSMPDDQSIMKQLDAISSELDRWEQSLPSDWSYDTISLRSHDSAIKTQCGEVSPYGGVYHVYKAPYIALGWCYSRAGRIVLGEILLSTLRRAGPGIAVANTRVQSSGSLVRCHMRQMAAGIYAGIPYLFGIESSASHRLEGLGSGCATIMPLWTAGTVEGPGHPLRQNAMLLLDLIAQKIGIALAAFQSDVLKDMEGTTEWLDHHVLLQEP